MSGSTGYLFQAQLSSYVPLVSAAGLLVALRVFVKVKIVRNLGPEDYACLFALLCAINSTVFFCREAYYATDGYDLTKVGLENLKERLKCVYAGGVSYSLSITSVKVSFLLQFLRIFRHKTMRIAIWTIFGIIIIYGGWAFFSSVFICWPIDYFWNFTDEFWAFLSEDGFKGKCLDPEKFYVAHAGLNIGTDVLILALPVPGLRHLMLPRGQKVALMLVFMLGGFVCVASTLRMLAFIKAFSSDYNTVWAGRSLGIWTAVEMDVAIICCCLPPLRPLVARILTRMKLDKGLDRSRSYLSSLLGPRSEKAEKSQQGDNSNISANCPSSMSYSSPVSGMATPDPSTESKEDKTLTSWLSMTQTIYEDEDDACDVEANIGRSRIDNDDDRFATSAV